MEYLQNMRMTFFCLICILSFRTENKLKTHENLCENKGFCWILMSSENNKISKFNQYMQPDKMSCIFYADIESLNRKIDGYINNAEIF